MGEYISGFDDIYTLVVASGERMTYNDVFDDVAPLCQSPGIDFTEFIPIAGERVNNVNFDGGLQECNG